MPKGVYKKSPEHIKKIIENFRPYWGKDNPFKGQHHTPETKAKLAIVAKTMIIPHHINLNHEDDTPSNRLTCSGRLHALVHKRAYLYLVQTGQIEQYLKWFESQQYQREGEIWKRNS